MIFQNYHEYLLKRDIWTEVKNGRVHMKLDRMAALRHLNDLERVSNEMKEINVNKKTCDYLLELVNEGSESFCGGTKEELIANLNGDVDLKPYIKKYQELQESGLIQRLKTKGALGKPRRRRKMSEHDGDWDFDRKWDLKPYQHFSRKRQLVKSMKVYANFSCAGRTDSREIIKYGALVWALIKVIEDSGIQTELYYQETAKDIGRNGTKVNVEMLIKKPGEYISPQAMAACFTSNHYRRLGFSLQCLSVPINDNDSCCSSMGSAEPIGKALSFEEGKLIMDVKSNKLSYEEVEKEVTKIIGGSIDGNEGKSVA